MTNTFMTDTLTWTTRAATMALMVIGASAAMAQAPLKTAVDGTFAPHAMPKLGGGTEGFNIDLAAEIAKAMNCTAYGLLVAIPLLGAYGWLQSKGTELIDDVHEAAVATLNFIISNRDKFAR